MSQGPAIVNRGDWAMQLMDRSMLAQGGALTSIAMVLRSGQKL